MLNIAYKKTSTSFQFFIQYIQRVLSPRGEQYWSSVRLCSRWVSLVNFRKSQALAMVLMLWLVRAYSNLFFLLQFHSFYLLNTVSQFGNFAIHWRHEGPLCNWRKLQQSLAICKSEVNHQSSIWNSFRQIIIGDTEFSPHASSSSSSFILSSTQ